MAKEKKKKQSKKNGNAHKTMEMACIHPDTAAIDIGSEQHWVAVPADRDEKPVRPFGCFTCDLRELGKWLKQCGIRSVAMESTGVYWIPLYEMLESEGFEVKLVNSYHVKNVPGRKSDVQDCQWLQHLHSVGLLNGAFRPEENIRVLRSLMRHRDNLVREASQKILQMQKALDQMNVHLHKVISDITGVTGMAIMEAILGGEHDPQALARLKHPQIKREEGEIAKALEGNYRDEHVFCLRQALKMYNTYQEQIAECDQEMQKQLNRFAPKVDIHENPLPQRKSREKRFRSANAPQFSLREELYKMTGVDLTQINGVNELTAWVFICELGTDLSKFPSAKHLTSYLGLCPNNRVSGGKRLQSRTRKVVSRVAQVLRMGAQSLLRSKSYLGAYCRKMKYKLDAPRAITATARKMAEAMYRMLVTGQDYVDLGEDYYERKNQNRIIKNLNTKASKMGYKLVPVNELQTAET